MSFLSFSWHCRCSLIWMGSLGITVQWVKPSPDSCIAWRSPLLGWNWGCGGEAPRIWWGTFGKGWGGGLASDVIPIPLPADNRPHSSFPSPSQPLTICSHTKRPIQPARGPNRFAASDWRDSCHSFCAPTLRGCVSAFFNLS